MLINNHAIPSIHLPTGPLTNSEHALKNRVASLYSSPKTLTTLVCGPQVPVTLIWIENI